MRRYLYIIILLLATVACREKYDIPLQVPQTGYLVVEGFINTAGTTNINLSRTAQLSNRRIIPELNAVVQIEGEDNSVYPLNDLDSGRYVSENLQLNIATKYRLHIKTQGNGEYLSDFKTALPTPQIDSLTWKRTNGGVEIFVNAYDPQDVTKYYKWDYEETWEFRSMFPAYLKFILGQGSNPNITVESIDSTNRGRWDSSRFFCWRSRISSNLLLGSTEKLSSNKVYFSLTTYPKDAWELSRLYSINVKQTGLSKEAYEFYDKMKKNTESLGSIFDAQPSEMTGNLKSVNNPAEVVIGYVDVTTQTEKRLFISVDDLPDWNYRELCGEGIIVVNTHDSLIKAYYDGYLPTSVYMLTLDGEIASVNMALGLCVDCRFRGTSSKPSFWPW